MEATEANLAGGCVNHASIGPSNQLAETSAYVHPSAAPRVEAYRGLAKVYPQNKRVDNPSEKQFRDSIQRPGIARMQSPDPPVGVSKCYVFKSRLQEYAQRVGLSTPTYETIREGPSHEPSFRSTVIVDGARYDSLLGFFNRKAAEQSAAEVALMELSTNGKRRESISIPLHETGLCKNVLQEYAQKMNYAIPAYNCEKVDSLFSCTVDIGGIQYIGAGSKSKKEAEKKAARTALLAIQSSGGLGDELGGKTNHTVVPCKRKVPDTVPPRGETSKPKKSKRPRIRKKSLKHMDPAISGSQIQAMNLGISVNNNVGTPVTGRNVQITDNGQAVPCLESSAQVNGSTSAIVHIREPSGGEPDVSTCNGSTDIAPVTKAPTSSQVSAVLPENGVDQGKETPTITCPNHRIAGNDDHGAGAFAITPMINPQASEQLDVENSDSRFEPKDPAQDPVNADALFPNVSPVLDHVIAEKPDPLKE